MDAKPQRPRAAMRITDENVPFAAHPAKSLHQRTKSTPDLANFQSDVVKANNKKVLGEANKNLLNVKVAPKDDSDIGKVSPGKFKAQQEASKVMRPLGSKTSALSQTRASTIALLKTQAAVEANPKLASKKSIKVMQDVLTVDAAPAPAVEPANLQQDHALVYQEVHETKSAPIRDEPMPTAAYHSVAPVAQSSEGVSVLQVSDVAHLQTQHHQHGLGAHAVVMLPSVASPLGPYYNPEDDEDEYDQDYATAVSFGLLDATGGMTTLLNPKYTANVEAELAAARVYVETTRSPEDVEDEMWDTSMVVEYGEDIFQYMRDLETRMAPNPHYMETQTEIQWSMRAVLVDWVVQVHSRFNLLPETLFLTVNYIDRFLSAKVVSLGKLQLVGATAIFLAAKYEEVNCPTISEIIFMVDNGYTGEELIKAERFMLSMLKFELGWPGPMSFLRRISKADDYDLETRTLAKYFLEVAMMDERFVGLTASYLAAGAHCMARFMLRKGDWSPAHVHYSNYTLAQLKKLLRGIVECCEAPQVHHAAVYEKYMDRRYKRASIFVHNEISSHGFKLPFAHGSSMGASDPSGLMLRQ